MIRSTLSLVVVLTALVSGGHAQTGGKGKNEAGEVEVTFANGSLVRMTLVQEKIETNTPYGKLSVPTRDIRRIEFGMHLPVGMDKRIEAAIKLLGSADYKEREGAVSELTSLGAYAFPAVVQAAKSSDLETAKRAQDALARIKAKVTAKELRLGPDDKVVTPHFTIVGRIVTPSLKARSEDFGDVDLSLTKLRHMRLVVDPRDTDVVVDAGKYAQSNQWLDTGVMLDITSLLGVMAGGEVELRPSQPGAIVCGPRGYTGAGVAAGGFGGAAGAFGAKAKKGGMPVRVYPGTLVGRIGENGDTFVIGDRFEASMEREGKLYLQIMSSPYDNVSTGSYHVKIMVRE